MYLAGFHDHYCIKSKEVNWYRNLKMPQGTQSIHIRVLDLSPGSTSASAFPLLYTIEAAGDGQVLELLLHITLKLERPRGLSSRFLVLALSSPNIWEVSFHSSARLFPFQICLKKKNLRPMKRWSFDTAM